MAAGWICRLMLCTSFLWQFAARHTADYMRKNYIPSLIEWAHFLNYLVSICRWNLVVIFDGRRNEAKAPEIELRKVRAANAVKKL